MAGEQAHERWVGPFTVYNTSTDLKIKPLLDPSACQEYNLNKARLPVIWKASVKAWVTRYLFTEGVHNVFVATIKKYLSDNPLPEVCLLLMDTSLAHPPASVDDMDVECDFREAKFLPAQHDASSAAHGPASNLPLQEAVRKGALHQVFQYH